MNNISQVINKDLCVSCGACASICPRDIISLKLIEGSFRATISDTDKCTDCGLCLKVCPSYHNDLASFSKENLFTGTYSDCFVAHSSEKSIRKNGASGGVITKIILELLGRGLYKKAAVVKYDNFDSTQAEYTITSDRQEIITAAKSKYISVSTVKILEFLKTNPTTPLIVVATPCQIYSIKSYCELRKISCENILFLGLFCEHTLNYNIYNFFTETYGDYQKFYFRSKYKKGWPGHTLITQNGENKIIHRRVRMALKPYFKLNRCRHCFDKLNSKADISFGDCYIKGTHSKKGKSSIIIRTSKAREALSQIKDSLVLSEGNFTDIAHSQHIAGLESNYTNAYNMQNQMYINYPYTPSQTTDDKQYNTSYSMLRMGAKAQYSQISTLIQDKIRRKSFIAKLIKKLIK
ncbi:MAG: Coenzyme F420 hydrogenase/dehydrogenase, beta subunit C-terminal domain [Rikenellaceae bacterium]